jgi:leucine dehydrogenase
MLDLDRTFDHERLTVFHDDATGVTGVVAIHSTALGPAMGGLRLRRYPSMDDAIGDALRLAKAMSLKNAAAGLDLGGGKAVLIDDGTWDDPARRAARMGAVGRVIDELGGRYITAEDVGTTPADMDAIASSTRWVAGRPVVQGGRGDPSPLTALTVRGAVRSAVARHLGRPTLAGVRVGVQGVGHVGSALVSLLRDEGAVITLSDADPARARAEAERVGARVVPPDEIVAADVDVLAPCAMGEVVDAATVATLRCSIVAGAANNPLSGVRVADALHRRGILYVPDFLANCGGIIHVGAEPLGLGDAEVRQLLTCAIDRTDEVLRVAQDSGRTALAVATALAEARLAAPAAPSLMAVA